MDHPAPRRLGLALVAAEGRHDQPVGRPGHGDVEQAVVLLPRLGEQCRARRVGGGAVLGPPPRPDRRQGDLRRRERKQGRVVAAEGLAPVEDHHDRRLQALGAVDRHDPDLVAARFEVALDRVPGLGPDVAGEEAAQRRGVLAGLGLGGGGEEHVDGVPGLAAEAGHQLGPAALRPEEPGVEAERAVEPRQRDPARQGLEPAPRGRVARFGVAVQRILQGLGEVAAGRDPHQVVVGEANERRLEGGREGQVVGRQEPRPAGGDQVGHGDVRGDLEPVLPGDRDADALQGADHLLEGGPALPDQDQDVPGAPDPAGRVPRGGPGAHRLRHPAGGDDRGSAGLRRVDGGGPGIRLRGRLRLGDRPQLHRAGRARPGTGMHGRAHRVLEREPLVVRVKGEDRVDGAQDEAGRAERQGERHVLEGQAG
ncbi:hypothetical protein AU375_01886 [Methylobacterium radiotolerans]|nr:hypothetical protein AU375_01886 [Methylobacterium radiotolerans]